MLSLCLCLSLSVCLSVCLFPVLVAKIPLVVMELVIKLLCFFYHTIFNMFIIYVSTTAVFLHLKTSKVVPLTKAKDLTDINNYRPISVLSSVSKPLEKHVHKYLLKYLDRLNLIHTHQSGFRPQHSYQSAFTCLVDRLLSSINDSKLNGVVFLDLRKAFDLTDHQILLKKKK